MSQNTNHQPATDWQIIDRERGPIQRLADCEQAAELVIQEVKTLITFVAVAQHSPHPLNTSLVKTQGQRVAEMMNLFQGELKSIRFALQQRSLT